MVHRAPRVGEGEGRKGKQVQTALKYFQWGHISGEQAHVGSPAGPPLGAGSRWPLPVGLGVEFQVLHWRPPQGLLSVLTLCSKVIVVCHLLALGHCLGLKPTNSVTRASLRRHFVSWLLMF